MRTAAGLVNEGLNVIGIPKTIDNDVWGTDRTFGFNSALNIATDAMDRLHSTANSHKRIMVIEIKIKEDIIIKIEVAFSFFA